MKKLALNVDFTAARLHAQVLLWRHGLLPIVALVMALMALFAGLLWLPALFEKVSLAEQSLNAVQQRQRNPDARLGVREVPPEVLFERALYAPGGTEQLIQRVFALSAESNVLIAQADYRRTEERVDGAGVSALQIALPLKAPFPQVRHFMLSLLSEFPSLSIDQVVIKRENAESLDVETQLLISVWERAESAEPAPRLMGRRP